MITARAHRKATIGSNNRLVSSRCVLGDDEASTVTMESFEVGPLSLSLIFWYGFFRQFGEKLVPMVDYTCCSLLSPLSYDMRRSVDEKLRGFPAFLDGLVPT